MSNYLASVKKGVREFKTVLYDLKQLRDCVLLWVNPGVTAVVITNQGFLKDQTYTLTVSEHELNVLLQSHYTKQEFSLDLKIGILKKNGDIHSLDQIVLINTYFQRALEDVSNKEAHVYQQ
ncbi:hypothetical protein CL658_03190 [bacterium]|nr:hypothetical protein [bacterium]|tara:strand:+ start:1472 stop:1834 length:363 start_codon:yes stop_codon:yes gene_type:complete